MLTSQVLSFNSASPSVALSAIVLGMAVLFAIQSYYYGWNEANMYPDPNEMVPVRLWVKRGFTLTEEITYATYNTYVDNRRFDWRWLTEVRKMGWAEEIPPPEVSIICSDGMREEANKIIKAANDKAHK